MEWNRLLLGYLEKYQLINDCLDGFRSGRSADDYSLLTMVGRGQSRSKQKVLTSNGGKQLPSEWAGHGLAGWDKAAAAAKWAVRVSRLCVTKGCTIVLPTESGRCSDPETRIKFSEGLWCAESESDVQISELGLVSEIS
ncbi:hypothetical protein EVAR_85288_1 [Eumeta japonica]|uniref:Uncharacterized protein n=1 Tax=Eumeta variegata TaxID=151549 RepID=A0A4C1V6V0_EUMVA|nr:hypothetical protein EVAR_85288_1 [Eumeta japonica]